MNTKAKMLLMAGVVFFGSSAAMADDNIDFTVPAVPNGLPNVGVWSVGRDAGTRGLCAAMTYDEGNAIYDGKTAWKTEITITVSPKFLARETGVAIYHIAYQRMGDDQHDIELTAERFQKIMSGPMTLGSHGVVVTRMPAARTTGP
jgi:hypothetical protein